MAKTFRISSIGNRRAVLRSKRGVTRRLLIKLWLVDRLELAAK
jgi:hypothetical protein